MKSIKTYLSIAILLFFTAANSFAQKVLTIDSAIQIALEHNRDIKMATLEIDKAEAKIDQAFGYAYPTLDVSAGFSHFLQKPKMPFPDFNAMLNNATYGVLFKEGVIPYDSDKMLPMGTELQAFAQTNNFQSKAELRQILFNAKVITGIGAAQIYLQLSKENIKRVISKTVLNVKKAFYGVILTRDLLDIAKGRFSNAKDYLGTIKSMRAQGLVSEFEELQAEVQVENIRPILQQLDNAHKSAANGLKILLNIDQDTEVNVTGKMDYKDEELPDEQELIIEALNSNLNIKTLAIKQKLDDAKIKITRTEFWPSVIGFANYSYSGSAENWKFQNYSSSSVGLGLSINLFKGFRTVKEIQQKKIEYKKTNTQISMLKDATVREVKTKLNEVKRVQRQIEAMAKNVTLAERAYQIAEDRYKEGEGIQLEVKNADVALSQAKINYTNAVHDYSIAKAELYDLIGRIDKKYYKFATKYVDTEDKK
jgi:outer membrane protein TolC